MTTQEMIANLEAKKLAGGKLSRYDQETLFLLYEQLDCEQWQKQMDAKALERDNSEENRRYVAAYGGQPVVLL